MIYTPNLKLQIPEYTDPASILDALRDNLMGIDSYVKKLEDENESLREELRQKVNVGRIKSWEPTLSGSVAEGNFTYTIRTGGWLRLGNIVMMWYNMHINNYSAGGAQGNLRILLPADVPIPAAEVAAAMHLSSQLDAAYAGLMWTSSGELLAEGIGAQLSGRIDVSKIIGDEFSSSCTMIYPVDSDEIP